MHILTFLFTFDMSIKLIVTSQINYIQTTFLNVEYPSKAQKCEYDVMYSRGYKIRSHITSPRCFVVETSNLLLKKYFYPM